MKAHGSRPSSVPTIQPFQAKLPGSINVSFYDGHVAQVRLENLWQLEWHRDWQDGVLWQDLGTCAPGHEK